MENTTPYSAKLQVKRVHIADVTIQGKTERLTWIRTGGLSVNILITETVVGNKLTAPRVIADFTVDETEEEVKAMCRDFVRRQNIPHLDQLPMPRLTVDDQRPDEEIEFDLAKEPLFGAPR